MIDHEAYCPQHEPPEAIEPAKPPRRKMSIMDTLFKNDKEEEQKTETIRLEDRRFLDLADKTDFSPDSPAAGSMRRKQSVVEGIMKMGKSIGQKLHLRSQQDGLDDEPVIEKPRSANNFLNEVRLANHLQNESRSTNPLRDEARSGSLFQLKESDHSMTEPKIKSAGDLYSRKSNEALKVDTEWRRPSLDLLKDDAKSSRSSLGSSRSQSMIMSKDLKISNPYLTPLEKSKLKEQKPDIKLFKSVEHLTNHPDTNLVKSRLLNQSNELLTEKGKVKSLKIKIETSQDNGSAPTSAREYPTFEIKQDSII